MKRAHAELVGARGSGEGVRPVADGARLATEGPAGEREARSREGRAGLDISTNVFWLASLGAGVAIAIGSYFAMPTMPPIAFAALGFVGAFGLPRWLVGFLTKRRLF